MATELRRLLDKLDPEDVLKVRTVRRYLESEDRPSDWLTVAEAAEVLVDPGGKRIPVRTLRSRCARWWSLQERGVEPSVRVNRSGERGRWLLSRGDCWRVRRENGGTLRPVSTKAEPKVVDTDAATVRKYIARVDETWNA